MDASNPEIMFDEGFEQSLYEPTELETDIAFLCKKIAHQPN